MLLYFLTIIIHFRFDVTFLSLDPYNDKVFLYTYMLQVVLFANYSLNYLFLQQEKCS